MALVQAHILICVASVLAICSAHEQFFYHCGVDFDQIWTSLFRDALTISRQRAIVQETEDLFTFKYWRALTIATFGFPTNYKAMTLSRLNSITNTFLSVCNRSKCFCKLVNNQMNYHWNKSVSCQMSGLQMITTGSWLHYILDIL